MTTKKKDEVVKRPATNSERFTQAVMREFKGKGELKFTEEHQRAIQTYFIALDNVLTTAEDKRLSKDEKYRDDLAFSWENINLAKLSLDVVAYANMGLNPLLPNHINMIPYKDSKTNKFNIGFIEGYAGKELIARRYALDAPDFAVVQLVHENDHFEMVLKDRENREDGYVFRISQPFDRGEVIGGFYYHVYGNRPWMNKIVAVPLEEIMKRKPEYASPEFWGGEKDEWKYDKQAGRNVKTGNKIKVEGWTLQMQLKTVKRMCWNDIVIDGNKVDENYKRAKASSMEDVDTKIENEITEKASKTELTLGDSEITPTPDPQPEQTPEKKTEAEPEAQAEKKEPVKAQPQPQVDKDGQARAF